MAALGAALHGSEGQGMAIQGKENDLSELREYLQQHADMWARLGSPAVLERFALRNGTEYAGRKLPKGYKRGTPKQCFANSAKLVEKDGLRYVEGFVWRRDLPMAFNHAWCIDENDRVIDVTLQRPEDCQYIGYAVSRAEVWKECLKSGVFGLLDHGLGLNVDWMFKIDPGLKDEVDAVMAEGGKQFKMLAGMVA